MFKFISPNGKENQFSSKVVEIPSNESPVKEILNRSDFSNYSIAKNERVYSLEAKGYAPKAVTCQRRASSRDKGVMDGGLRAFPCDA